METYRVFFSLFSNKNERFWNYAISDIAILISFDIIIDFPKFMG